MNDELEKLLKAGTPTPWFVGGVRFKMDRSEWHGIMSYNEAKKQDDNVCLVGYDPRTGEGYADARLIVAAVNALPELIAMARENERLREALAILDAADEFEGEPDDKKLFVAMRVADLRRARAALKESGQ